MATKDSPCRPPDIEPELIQRALRQAHRMRAETVRRLACAALAAAGRGLAALGSALAPSPHRRGRTPAGDGGSPAPHGERAT